MKPLIKYPGGKEKEIKIIREYMPCTINDYYEPFVGGGAVFWELAPGKQNFINDISSDLINFYVCVKNRNKSFYCEIIKWNDLFKEASITTLKLLPKIRQAYYSDSRDLSFIKFDEMYDGIKKLISQKFDHIDRKAEKNDGIIDAFEDNIEAAFKQAVYCKARDEFNAHKRFDGKRAALYMIMRQYGFSGMFRYNAAGDFNIPYGGIPYNNKFLDDRINQIKSKETRELMNRTTISSVDFEEFLDNSNLQVDDFIFLDPPYDTTFTAYDGNEFSRKDQERLSKYLIKKCPAKWMVVIKATDFIRDLYPVDKKCANGKGINIVEFGKRYDVCMKGRNEQRCEHLLIRNYQ